MIINKLLQTTVKPLLGPKSLHSYAQFVRLDIVPRIDRHEFGKLTPQHVQVMMGEMSAAGLSPRIVQYTRAVLRRALGYALKWGLVSRNVATLVDPPRSQRRPAKWLTGEQARFLLDHARTADNRWWPLLATAVLTGLRQGELLGLRWENVDLNMGTLGVTHSLQRIDGDWRFIEPKTKRSARTLVLPPSIVSALREQRDRQLFERRVAGE